MDQTIARIAEQLGFQAARIWPQVVMVTWITSLFWTVVDPLVALLCVGLLVRLLRYNLRRMRELKAEKAAAELAAQATGGHVSSFDFDETGIQIASAMGGVVLAVVLFFAIGSFPDQLAGVLYPEAVTVMRLAKSVH